jgi:DNA-binding beta-propeller fold protein YncE
VYVADTGNDRIVHLWNSGKELAFAASMGSRGRSPGRFSAPRQVALDTEGNIYVTDWGNNRIQVLGYHGELRAVFDHIPHPDGIAVNDTAAEWSYHKEYALYVSASDRRQILRLDERGQIAGRVEAGDTPYAEATFAYLALDYYDNVYATDPINHCIHKFDRQLNYIVSYGKKGTKHTGEFLSPRGIAIWRRFGQVLVAEKQGAQYYWIGSDLLDVELAYLPKAEVVRVSFRPTEYAYVSIEVFNGEQLVRRLWRKVIANPVPKGTHWDLKDDAGSRVAPGAYEVRMTVEPTYSSYRHFRKQIERTIEIP